jgi:hypothetical protein
MLSPLLSSACCIASGFVAAKLAGHIASTHCLAANRVRSFAAGSRAAASTSSST